MLVERVEHCQYQAVIPYIKTAPCNSKLEKMKIKAVFVFVLPFRTNENKCESLLTASYTFFVPSVFPVSQTDWYVSLNATSAGV